MHGRSSLNILTCDLYQSLHAISVVTVLDVDPGLFEEKNAQGLTKKPLPTCAHFFMESFICDGFHLSGSVKETHQIMKANHSFTKELLQMS